MSRASVRVSASSRSVAFLACLAGLHDLLRHQRTSPSVLEERLQLAVADRQPGVGQIAKIELLPGTSVLPGSLKPAARRPGWWLRCFAILEVGLALQIASFAERALPAALVALRREALPRLLPAEPRQSVVATQMAAELLARVDPPSRFAARASLARKTLPNRLTGLALLELRARVEPAVALPTR